MAENDENITEDILRAKKRIETKMDELKVFDYHTLLLYSSVIALELEDKGLSWNFPNGFDYNTYAAKMLLKGAELGKQYHVRKANEKSHEETNKMKDEITVDYKANKNSRGTKDEAAIYYTKHYPLKFSTIRNYLKNL